MKTTEDLDQAKTKHREDVERLISINNGNRFEVWKFCEDHAHKLQSTLWDQGKWLLALQGGVLFLPFTAKLIELTTSFPFMASKNLILIILLYLFGVVISAYTLAFQKEIGEHIARNFDRAICAREGSLCSISPPNRILILWCTTFCFIAAYILAPAFLTLEKLLTRP